VNTNLRDPDISPEGRAQCEAFAKSFEAQERYITHIISSPMSRTLSTARIAFGRVPKVLHNSGFSIIAVPELQNFDKGANGTGMNATTLAKMSNFYSRFPPYFRVDVSLVPSDWNLKQSGKWSKQQWRIDHIKGHLQGLWVGAGAGTKHIEVVVVSHSSFFRKLFEGD